MHEDLRREEEEDEGEFIKKKIKKKAGEVVEREEVRAKLVYTPAYAL